MKEVSSPRVTGIFGAGQNRTTINKTPRENRRARPIAIRVFFDIVTNAFKWLLNERLTGPLTASAQVSHSHANRGPGQPGGVPKVLSCFLLQFFIGFQKAHLEMVLLIP